MNDHTNELHVDADAELAAIAAAGARAASIEQQAAIEQRELTDTSANWYPDACDAVAIAADGLVPAWGLTEADRERIALPLSRLLDRWLPGGMAGVDNWHPLWQLGAALSVVTAVRGFDYKRAALKPMREAKSDDESETAGRHPPVPNRDDAKREDGGSFIVG